MFSGAYECTLSRALIESVMHVILYVSDKIWLTHLVLC